MQTKEEIRREKLAERSRIPFTKINQWSKKITNKFFQLPELESAKKIMSFVSKEKEVNTFDLMENLLDEGYLLYVPYTITENNNLGTAQINDLDSELKEGVFGVMEPKKSIRDEEPPHDLDIIIVPGAVFTRDGYRIGYGGGYYDSFLNDYGKNALKVGFCYSKFIIDQFPVEEHDIAVDLVITEKEVINTKD